MRLNTGKSKKIIQKIIISFIAIAVIFVFDFAIFAPQQFSAPSTDPSLNKELGGGQIRATIKSTEERTSIIEESITEQEEENKIEGIVETSAEILKQIKPDVNLEVPFTVQAPHAVWDDLHNEACEEAVLIMAKYWLNNSDLNKETAEQEILDSVKWQEENFGGHYDLQVLDIVDLARRYFTIEKIYYSSVNSIDDIKHQLSKGNVVITPMAGRLLNNPYYKPPGPPYHTVVVKGYDKNNIITNDPGTRRGADFSYSYDNFLNSIHDWPFALGEKTGLSKDERAQEVLKGEKMMIVVEKE
ncbi:C39 family peptidase [Patescibacteria group bacterium AH-259-L07]|nr:C39 family peptidase [Patescibacteria group bacterium AH-259-L07]